MNMYFCGIPYDRVELLTKAVKKTFDGENCEVNFAELHGVSEIPENSNSDFYICFAEGNVGSNTVVQLACEIRARNRAAHIVFLSENLLSVMTILRSYICPAGYFLMSEPCQAVASFIKNVYKTRKALCDRDTKIHIVCDYRKNYISSSKILFFMSTNKKIVCHLVNGDEMVFYDTLNNLEQQYADYFVRVHSGFLVNKSKIVRYDFSTNCLNVENCSVNIPISRKYKYALKPILKSV